MPRCPTPRSPLLASALAALLATPASQAQDHAFAGQAAVVLDYQQVRVPGDEDIDFMGFHLHHRVGERLWLGAGVYAPLVKGQYGGFTAFDVGVHWRQPLSGPLSAVAGLSGGGGGGGRSIAQSKVLSGTGGFYKAYAGLDWDFGGFTLGANVAKMAFKDSAIDSTHANLVLTIPYGYQAGDHARSGQPLDERELGAADGGESLLMATLDSYRQLDPKGSFKGTVRSADLQYAHYLGRDTYWFGALGVGVQGLPLYNQVMGGFGQRLRLSPRLNLYGQLAVGSGGYAPEKIDTDAGLLVYPRVAAEWMVGRDTGLALSAGYLWAPKGSSRNLTYGLALTQHLRSGAEAAAGGTPRWQGFRVGVFQQTEYRVSYRGQDRDALQLVGVQVDAPLDARWYIPVQAAVAYNAYLGYPGYGELLAGLGAQTLAAPGDRLQAFAQLMGGSNVHGLGVKAGAGVRWLVDERLSVQLSAGRIEARNPAGRRFSADSALLGLEYRFAVPMR